MSQEETNVRQLPTQLANQKIQQQQNESQTQSNRELADSINELSQPKEKADPAIVAMMKLVQQATKTASENESEQTDAMHSVSSTILGLTIQAQRMFNPTLQRETLRVLRSIDGSLVGQEEATTQPQMRTVFDETRRGSFSPEQDKMFARLISQIKDRSEPVLQKIGGAGNEMLERTADESGPLSRFMLDMSKKLVSSVREKKETVPAPMKEVHIEQNTNPILLHKNEEPNQPKLVGAEKEQKSPAPRIVNDTRPTIELVPQQAQKADDIKNIIEVEQPKEQFKSRAPKEQFRVEQPKEQFKPKAPKLEQNVTNKLIEHEVVKNSEHSISKEIIPEQPDTKSQVSNPIIVDTKELENLSEEGNSIATKILKAIEGLLDFARLDDIRTRDRLDDEQTDRLQRENKAPALVQQAELAPDPNAGNTEDGGGILGMITSMLGGLFFGKEGVFGGIKNIFSKIKGGLLNVLSPSKWMAGIKSLAEGAKASIGGVVSSVKGLFSGLGDIGEAGKFVKLAKGAKAIPVIGEVIAVGMAIYDFFDGFMNAGDFLGKTKEATTLWDRVSVGLASIVGGLVGIVDAILSIFGFDTDIGGFVREKLAFFLAEIPNKVSDLMSSIFDPIIGMFDGISPALSKTLKGMAKIVVSKLIPIPSIAKKIFPALYAEEPAEDKTTAKKVDKPEAPVENVSKVNDVSVPIPNENIQPAKPKESLKQNVEKTKQVEEQKRQAESTASSVQNQNVNQNNINQTKTTVINSQPISTRPNDDSFRIGFG